MYFREIIRPPLWVLAFIYFLLFSIVIAIWASLNSLFALVSFILSIVLIVFLAFELRLKIEISDEEFRVGTAHIHRKYIKEVHVLSIEQMKLIRTRDADPASFLAIRFWQPRGIKIELNDPRDSTPYWLVTSKRGEEIATLLNSKN